MTRGKLLALSIATLAAAVRPARAEEDVRPMPPSPERIEAALVRSGAISATATPQEREAAVTAYLRSKLAGAGKEGNPVARKRLEEQEARAVRSAPALRGRKLGTAAVVPSSTPQFRPLAGTDKLLLILVEFSETPYTWTPSGATAAKTASGPLHNQLPVPDNSFDLWIPDFSTQHYEDMLFTPGGWTLPNGEHRGSMRDYYVSQSFGRYTVDGQAYGWYQLPKPEAYYGDDAPTSGHDNRGPGTMATLLADAVKAINASGNPISWQDYDTNKDCVIDHPLFIHAGADQSGGGGAQGDDAIWAHSSARWTPVMAAPPGWEHCANGFLGYLWIYNYTIMPEDGGVGVFAHEFGHDLGLPDEYDTIYSSPRGESVANWSLMSSGSWMGRPAQTEPPSMSIWGRMQLGWLTPGDDLAVVDFASLGKDGTQLRLEQSNRWGGPGTQNGALVLLPDKQIPANAPHAGAMEWWGGRANDLDATLTRTIDLTGKTSATLSFWTWYETEESWDFGFVQASTDGGATWSSLAVDGTTSVHDPDAEANIVANLPGFTGSSNGWVQKTVDLSPFAGGPVQLQFRYMTDAAVNYWGFFVDDVSVVANGQTVFTDGAEQPDPAWSATGWTRTNGVMPFLNYYMAEWRNLRPFATPLGGSSIVNFDAGLNHAYQSDAYGSTGNPNEPWWYPYNSGLVLWYRDTSFSDNWTGVHPKGGFLLVVDAHAQPILRPSASSVSPGVGVYPFNTHVQSSDAAFSLDRTQAFQIGYWGATKTEPSQNAIPIFDDTLTYWNVQTPYASVVPPRNGLLLRVLGEAADGSAAVIGVGPK